MNINPFNVCPRGGVGKPIFLINSWLSINKKSCSHNPHRNALGGGVVFSTIALAVAR